MSAWSAGRYRRSQPLLGPGLITLRLLAAESREQAFFLHRVRRQRHIRRLCLLRSACVDPDRRLELFLGFLLPLLFIRAIVKICRVTIVMPLWNAANWPQRLSISFVITGVSEARSERCRTRSVLVIRIANSRSETSWHWWRNPHRGLGLLPPEQGR